ncbi:hypothetical protein VL20_457 [Microcystis panniformis FACHB-1757]|uniref:Uncharacterized protein n=1 Tax=Microcystis panniformis FACHB-1757 TaxID=1638788 RepID=A0A0K1RUW6_9CHRO|nr:hypothetical protein VL20_457 [Microcystis panniformis FACHB-1757]
MPEMDFLLGITITFGFGSTDCHYLKKLLNWKGASHLCKRVIILVPKTGF